MKTLGYMVDGVTKYPNDPYLKTWTERAQDSLTVRFLMESL